MKHLTTIFVLVFTLVFAVNTYPQRQKKYPIRYEIFTNQAKIIRVHDAISYKDRIGMRFPNGNLDYMYIDPNVHNIHRTYPNLPNLKLNKKGKDEIKVKVKKDKKQLYRDLKKWIANARKYTPNEKLLKDFYIKFYDLPEKKRGSVIKDNELDRLKYKGYSPRLFCTRERVCRGGVYVINIKLYKGKYKLSYKGYPMVDVNDSLKSNNIQKMKFIREFYDEEKRLYIFGLRAYNFQVNSISNSIYEYLSDRDTYVRYFGKEGRDEKEKYMQNDGDSFVLEKDANPYDKAPFIETERIRSKNYGGSYKKKLLKKYNKEDRRELYERERDLITKKKTKKKKTKKPAGKNYTMDASY